MRALALALLLGGCALPTSDISPCERAEWSADMVAWIRAEAAKPGADAERWLRWERQYTREYDEAVRKCSGA